MHLPRGGPAHGRSQTQGDHRGSRVPDLPGMPQSLHVSEVKGCDDHWTHREKPRAGQQQVTQTWCTRRGSPQAAPCSPGESQRGAWLPQNFRGGPQTITLVPTMEAGKETPHDCLLGPTHPPPSPTHTQRPSPRGSPGRQDELMGFCVQTSPLPLTAKGTQVRALTAECLSFPICEMVRVVPQALRGAVRFKQEQLVLQALV